MKLYSEAPQASMKMGDDPALAAALDAAIEAYGTRIAIETGTYEGTGSTPLIARSLQRAGDPITFVTFEVNFNSWLIACRNLQPFPFVDCLWGCSIDRQGALDFIKHDEALHNHHAYADIYIDDVEDPVGFYSSEVNGALGAKYVDGGSRLKRLAARARMALGAPPESVKMKPLLWRGEGLLPAFLRLHRDNRPLVVLDSAGGCGLYEFKTMMETMRDASFLLLLDDTHHLKHFRSLDAVRNDPRFKLLGHSALHGWALAWHE